jgi:HD-GYP domain-containing protein (c-di-GMP phosphodiesterase class II)
MKKKIPVEELKIGMFVAELDRTAEFSGMLVSTQAQIDKLKRYCRYVYIDLPESHPPHPNNRRPISRRWPSSAFLTAQLQRLEFEMLKLSASPIDKMPRYQEQTTTEHELNTVRPAYEAGRRLMRETTDNLKQGKDIDAVAVRNTAAIFAQSIIRNPDALVYFTQLGTKADFTAMHMLRACIPALALGRHLGLPIAELTALATGVLLMDIGKIRIPDEILHKPGSLNEQEFEIARGHVAWGTKMSRNTPGIPEAAIDVVRYHHEHYDGSGYPHGLKGRQIPHLAQIGSLADCYDALISNRPYGMAMSPHHALTKIYELRNRKFDPRLVAHFIQSTGIYPIGSVVELNTGEVAVVLSVNRVRRLKPRVRLVLRANKSAYRPPMTANLMQDSAEDGRPFEIEHALAPGAYGIRAAEYLGITGYH